MGSLIRDILIFIMAPFLVTFFLFAYLFSYIFPRSKYFYLFEYEGIGIPGNSKYLFFLIISKLIKTKKRRFILITNDKRKFKFLKNKGINIVYTYSPKGLLYTLSSKWHILYLSPGIKGSILGFLTGGANILQIWHGIPMKKIGYRTTERLKEYSNVELFLIKIGFFWWAGNNIFRKKLKVISPSKFLSKIFTSAFNISQSDVIIAEYPRNIILTNRSFYNFMMKYRPLEEIRIYKKLKRLKRRDNIKLFLYVPTYRNKEREINLNFYELNKILKELNGFLIVKMHWKNYRLQSNMDRIIFIDPNIDMQFILPLVDILITDYSSVFFDFLILDRPIIFYPYDISNYKINRGLYFNYENFVPGPIAYTKNELYKIIRNYISNKKDKYKSHRRKILNLVSYYKGDISGIKPILRSLKLLN